MSNIEAINTDLDTKESEELVITYGNGIVEYRTDNLIHRVDGPARIDAKNGLEQWYFQGMIHRDNGPAYINKPEDTYLWYYHDKPHRVGGPALERRCGPNPTYIWMLHGMKHRVDGPAFIKYDEQGVIVEAHWMINDKKMPEIDDWVANNCQDPVNLTEEELFEIRMRFNVFGQYQDDPA